MVFGAGVRGERPTRILAQRIQAAVELYQLGRVSKLLMTGDNGRADYDEVTVMGRYAESLGVPPEDITLDYAGFSTYESCYRRRTVAWLRRSSMARRHRWRRRAIDGGRTFADLELFDRAMSQWAAEAPMPTARSTPWAAGRSPGLR